MQYPDAQKTSLGFINLMQDAHVGKLSHIAGVLLGQLDTDEYLYSMLSDIPIKHAPKQPLSHLSSNYLRSSQHLFN